MSLGLAATDAQPLVCKEGEQTVASTLATVAQEMERLARIGDHIQDLISGALLADIAATPEHVRDIQAIDLLVQHLRGIATFLSGLSDRAEPQWLVDTAGAALNVPLQDLADKLGGHLRTVAVDANSAVQGDDLDLFG
jgi:hypothetical protein